MLLLPATAQRGRREFAAGFEKLESAGRAVMGLGGLVSPRRASFITAAQRREEASVLAAARLNNWRAWTPPLLSC